MSPQKSSKRSPAKQGSAHVPVWASFGGPPPPSGDYTALLGHSTDPQTDTAAYGQLLTSPRLSSPGDLEPPRPYLDVQFINMGMRLKGTGRKVLAGVTGRLRASHLTAIMGPSGAGEPVLHAQQAIQAVCFSPRRCVQLGRSKLESQNVLDGQA